MKERLLLHLCWPKASYEIVKQLSDKYDVTTYFYNPNIESEEEYKKRYNDAIELGRSTKHIEFNDDAFQTAIAKFEISDCNCQRCLECYSLRIEKTIIRAVDDGYNCVATTLSVIPGKSAELINAIGMDISSKYGIIFIESDFSEIASGKYDYCGCTCSKTRDA
ncbi:epoxyqueuosine reductase QueH [Candidatus Woesearchaeota archaeon]|nr:epoxyqueuosine reductase QueH [Candidatus Woesearchaeota archaeon]